MRRVGQRQEPPITFTASSAALAEGARFSETMHRIAGLAFIPKGIYRFKSHEEANRHWQDCLVAGMARLARERRR
jgi:hypothetical protein